MSDIDLTEAIGVAHCGAPDCSRHRYCGGYCSMHYQRMRKHGSLDRPARRRRTVDEAFAMHVIEVKSGCWQWSGPLNDYGYGVLWLGQKRYAMAHRASYERHRGPIPPGLTLDHLCRNRACVNPDHLDPVPGRENVLRGIGITAQNARKSSCAHGHPFDANNTYRRPDGSRSCRICRQDVKRRARIARTGAA